MIKKPVKHEHFKSGVDRTEEFRTKSFFFFTDTSLSSYHEKATVALSFERIRTRLGADYFPSIPVDVLTSSQHCRR